MAAIGAADEGIAILDGEGIYTYVNQAYASSYDQTQGTVIGTHWQSRYPTDEIQRFHTNILIAVDETGSWNGTVTALRDGGKTFPEALSITNLDDGGYVFISRDMSNPVQQQTELQVKDKAMNEANVGMVLTDPKQPDNPIVYANTGFSRMTGYATENVIGRNCRFLQGEKTDQKSVASIRDAVAAGEPIVTEIYNYRADGTPFWNRIQIDPIFGPDGSVTHFFGLQQDITEEVARREQLGQYEQTVQAAGDPIIVIDDRLTVCACNEQFEAFLDRTKSEIIGSDLSQYIESPQKDELYITSSAGTTKIEAVFETRTKLHALCELTFAPLSARDSPGDAVIVLREITAQRQREQRLAVFDRILRHNIRNKIGIIRGHLEIAEENTEADRSVDAIQTAHEGSTELLELAESARLFEKLLQQDRNIDTVVLHSVLQSVFSGSERDVSHTICIEETLLIQTDQELLQQVCQLLIQLAIAHRIAKPTISIHIEESSTIDIVVTMEQVQLPEHELAVIQQGEEAPLIHSDGIQLWFLKWALIELGGDIDVVQHSTATAEVQLSFPTALFQNTTVGR